jgi:hypothetical protein
MAEQGPLEAKVVGSSPTLPVQVENAIQIGWCF